MIPSEHTKHHNPFSTGMGISVLCLVVLVGSHFSYALPFQDVDDRNIAPHLETEFWIDESVPSDSIDIETRNGIVTLGGSVDNILAKERAERIAAATVGVRSIVNNIKVKPPSGLPDAEVGKSVERALLLDPATDLYEVNVDVQEGVVTLTGRVDSMEEKKICSDVAKSVAGVVGIENEIVVDFKSDRTDAEIEQDIKKRFFNDVRLDDLLVNVRVKDGTVHLGGTVGSLQEKNLAIDDAWVRGVREVDARDLDIEWWARDEMRREKLLPSRTDQEIESAVVDAFFYDPRVEPSEVDVEVEEGSVVLGGIVDNLKAKIAAEKDALNTTGVVSVVNHIKVRPAMIPSDKELENAVKKALVTDPYVEDVSIGVDAHGGFVRLYGTVNTSWEYRRAGRIAENVSGVVRVRNHLEYRHKWVWKPDWEIERDVKEHLYWSPFINEDRIDVSVKDGIVTLTGRVDNYGEWKNAEENAFEGGAKDVLNRLLLNIPGFGPYYPWSPFAK